MSQDCKLIQRWQKSLCPLHSSYHHSILVLKLLYPLSLDGFTSSKSESAMQHFLHSTHEQETQVGIISLSTQATCMDTFSCNALPFYSGSVYNNPQNPCEQPIIFSVIPPFPQTVVTWSLFFPFAHIRITIKPSVT